MHLCLSVRGILKWRLSLKVVFQEECVLDHLCVCFSAAGFEGCSMVPSIYPLETLHNSLSLKQVDEFLTGVCKNGSETQFKRLKSLSAMFESHAEPSIDVESPETPVSTPVQSSQPPDRPLWYSSGPDSTVSSAGPSSPSVTEPSSNSGFNSE